MAAPDMHTDDYPSELAVGVTKDRITQVSPAARAMHRAILRAFAATGQAPGRAAVANVASGDVEVLLAELHGHDVIRLGADGRIRAAYPFSGVPTAHRVEISGGPVVFAMCAIDALGIAAMLGRDITITSTEPATGAPITVTVTPDGQAAWQPQTAVVLAGSDTTLTADGQTDCCATDSGGQALAAAADRCCAVMNLFTSPVTAQQWLATHPQISGVVLTHGQSLRLGIDIFGSLLNDEPGTPHAGGRPS